MTSLVTRVPSVKPARPKTLRFLRYVPATGTLTLRVVRGRQTVETAYSLERIGSQFGDGFRLTKNVGHAGDECDRYDLHLSDEGHTCECRGNLQHGHCKHVDAVVRLRDLGMI